MPSPPWASSNWTREGAAPPPLSFSLSYSFPLSPLGKGRGLQLGLGILVGLPYGAPPWPTSSSPSFIYMGRGAPQS